MTVRDFFDSLANLGWKFADFIIEVLRVVLFNDNILDAPILVGLFAAIIWLYLIGGLFAALAYLWVKIFEKPLIALKEFISAPIIRVFVKLFGIDDIDTGHLPKSVSIPYNIFSVLQALLILAQFFALILSIGLLIVWASIDFSLSNAKPGGLLTIGLVLSSPFTLAFINKIAVSALLKRHLSRSLK